MDTEAAEIIELIHTAFRDVVRGEISLHEAEVIDVYGTTAERREARKRDTDQHWTEIPDRHVEHCTTALCHVDPVSWQYYIPRYMEWSLRSFKTSDSVVSDFTIYTFERVDEQPDLVEYAMERFRRLTPAQSKVVARFLRYMARHGDDADDVVALRALERHWAAFEEPGAQHVGPEP